MLFGISVAHSQESRTEIYIDFRVNSTHIDSGYRNNAERISKLISFLQQIRADSTASIVNVDFCGAASPEGSYEWNRKLANGRLKTLEKLVRSKVDIPDSIVTYDDSYIPWEYLANQISASEISHKQEILSIIGEKSKIVEYYKGRSIDSRILKLQKLAGGKVWREMLRRFFSPMRNACAVFITFRQTPPPPAVIPEPVVEEADTVVHVEPAPDTTAIVETVVTETEEWSRKLHIKTNVPALGLGIANIAAEIDLARHWSFALPIYYSAWNYFKSTRKFRTFAVQPELRFWLSEKNDGFFAGAHFGLAYYNFAFDGDYRYQDHDRETPAIGGGMSIGYRLSLSKNKRWKMEFSIGAGVYPLHYDKFHNTPNTKDGLKVESIKKTYWGIDQVAVSFLYMIDLKKKGGRL